MLSRRTAAGLGAGAVSRVVVVAPAARTCEETAVLAVPSKSVTVRSVPVLVFSAPEALTAFGRCVLSPLGARGI